MSKLTSGTESAKVNREQLLASCSALANKPDILQELREHLTKHGFAGSTDIPEIIVLSMITRSFPNPVSLIIKGQSGSGKSFALKSGLRYVPSSAFHEFHGMSAKALVHASDLDFKNRFLVVQEFAGMAKEGMVFLRQLLTEGKVNYRTVDQGRDGYEGKALPAIEGPTGLMMTTTAHAIHWEDETRMLSLHVDQSPEQIERALMVLAGDAPPEISEKDLSQWHALHEYVCSGGVEVTIPYRRELLSKLPRSHSRVLRDGPKVLALIQAHALLHQCTRERLGDKVVATPEDYEAIYRLVSKPLAYNLKAEVPPHISEVVKAALELHSEGNGGVTVSQGTVAKRLGKDQTNVGRNLATAIREGFLINRNPGQGQIHDYAPGERELPSETVLPDPCDLGAIKAATLAPRNEDGIVQNEEIFVLE
jgi:hypothetical protein